MKHFVLALVISLGAHFGIQFLLRSIEGGDPFNNMLFTSVAFLLMGIVLLRTQPKDTPQT